jgi:hypothetical protein
VLARSFRVGRATSDDNWCKSIGAILTSNKDVLETPRDRGPQNHLHSDITPIRGAPGSSGVVRGVEKIYLRKPNTVYVASIWGPFITKGREAGITHSRSLVSRPSMVAERSNWPGPNSSTARTLSG